MTQNHGQAGVDIMISTETDVPDTEVWRDTPQLTPDGRTGMVVRFHAHINDACIISPKILLQIYLRHAGYY